MKEILGSRLVDSFFSKLDGMYQCDYKQTYQGTMYNVYVVSDQLFDYMDNMSEEEFTTVTENDDSWWRYSEGSVLGDANKKLLINGKGIFAWESPIGNRTHYRYKDLLTYLRDCLGVSTPKNVCACAKDLAKYNNMSLGELFSKYQGN